MKKILLSCLLGLFVIGLTGCDFGKKGTVTCTMEPNNELIDSVGEMPKQEIIIDYQGKKIKNAVGNYIYSTAEVAKTKYDELLAIAKNDKARTNFKVEGNKINDIMNTDDVINLAVGNSDDKDNKQKDKVVDSLKAQGYTCK